MDKEFETDTLDNMNGNFYRDMNLRLGQPANNNIIDTLEESTEKVIQISARQNTFFKIMEKEIGSQIPIYLKHLLTFLGYDCAAAMKNFNESTITELEKFAREDLSNILANSISKGIKKSDFYGNIFATQPNKFIIVSGHKKFLLEMVEIIKSKPLQSFFNANVVHASTSTIGSTTQQSKQVKNSLSVDRNLLEEEKKLISLLKSWYLRRKSDSKATEDTEKQSAHNFIQTFLNKPTDYVTVSIKESLEGPPGDLFTYSAILKCSVCGKLIPAIKAEYGSKKQEIRKTRWVFSNFTKHVENKHLIPTQRKITSEGKLNQPRITTVFKNITNNTANNPNDRIATTSQGKTLIPVSLRSTTQVNAKRRKRSSIKAKSLEKKCKKNVENAIESDTSSDTNNEGYQKGSEEMSFSESINDSEEDKNEEQKKETNSGEEFLGAV